MLFRSGTDTGTSMSDDHVWNALWKLKVVPKIRVFWWRVLRGILPDEVSLSKRHVKDSSMCKVCLAMNEDLMHALIHCSHAKQFWAEAQLWFDFRLHRLHPDTWRQDILCDSRFDEHTRAKIVSVMWSIWHSRNLWTHDKEESDPRNSMRIIRETLAILELPREQAAVLPGHGWRPPEQGSVKINTDAAIDSDHHKGGAGGVARSSSGLVGAWCKPHGGVTDPSIAEALALRDGVIVAKLRGFQHVIMEMDCLEVVNLWKSRHNSRSVVAPLLLEIGDLSTCFSSFVIQHVPRASNFPAHLCAKRACGIDVTESWFDSEPSS